MNSCQKLSELFSDYIERALHEEDRQEVEVHLKKCPPCQQAVSRIGKLQRALKSLPALETSPDFETVLRTRMRLERHRVRPWTFAMPFAPMRGMAFAGIVVLVLGSSIFIYWQAMSKAPIAAMKTRPVVTVSSQLPPSSPASLQSTAYQLYIYSIDHFTLPRTPGDALRISSAGVEKYQAERADSTATETAQTALETVQFSF